MDRDGVHHKQHPYYELDWGKNPPPHNDDKTKPKGPNPLERALIDIVDKNKDQSIRLAMIPNIVNNYMSAYAKVLTVGTDLETVVDYENPRDFLRRICLSPYISRVNVISKDGDMLTVHEIRTK